MIANGFSSHSRSVLGRYADRFGMGTLLAFFSARVLRGGPRILVYLATFLVLLLVVIRVIPRHLTEASFGSTNHHLWNWHGDENGGDSRTEAVGSRKGTLRIVVFGENDFVNPARTHPGLDDAKPRSWAEMLCEELECSSYLSFVPTFEGEGRSLTSNTLYAASIDETLNETAHSTSPAQNYTFLPAKYPVAWDLPDLSDQVSEFLSMEKPEDVPGETLWVFSFGTWDIWSLSTMPRSISTRMIDLIVAHIFHEIERLYRSSLDENSIAWSNSSLLPATEKRNVESSGVNTLPEGFNATAVLDSVEAEKGEGNGGSGGRAAHQPPRFRILMPKLLDMTLTPGWRTGRPELPHLHTKVEQLRNAVALTDHWNGYLHKSLEDWVDTPGPKDGDEDSETGEYRQPPQRDAIAYDLPSYLTEMVVEGQLHAVGLTDSRGVGTKPTNQTFREVWTPCIRDISSSEDDSLMGITVSRVNTSMDATDSETKRSSPPSSIRRRVDGPDTTDNNGESTEAAETQMQVCDSPHDHLFSTAFALSQRAIADIAAEAAAMVRRNDSLRARRAAADAEEARRKAS